MNSPLSSPLYVVASGDVWTGIILYGPFKTRDLAWAWAQVQGLQDPWRIVPLVPGSESES